MTKAEIDGIFERVRSWPPERQEKAAEILLVLEEQEGGVYELSDEERADIEKAEAEMERGEFATDEEVAAIFARYRAP